MGRRNGRQDSNWRRRCRIVGVHKIAPCIKPVASLATSGAVATVLGAWVPLGEAMLRLTRGRGVCLCVLPFVDH